VARGIAPVDTTVPTAIAEGRREEGFDASGSRPFKVQVKDVGVSLKVIVISTPLPLSLVPEVQVERWDDVPLASEDFRASSRQLRRQSKH
jgi:hypothetical protein